MREIKLIFSLTVLALIIIFVIQNTEVLNVDFLFWSFQIRRALLLFIVFTTGIVIGWLVHGWPRRRAGGRGEGEEIGK